MFEIALFLDPQDSFLETRSSRLEIRVTGTSRREDRVETVNLHLSSTVCSAALWVAKELR